MPEKQGNNEKKNGKQAVEKQEKIPEQVIVKKRKEIENYLSQERVRKSLELVAPKHLTPEKIVKLALVAASRNPEVYKCTPQSILQAIMEAAEVGLDFTGNLGQGWLVAFYNSNIKAYECQFIPGYQGLIEIAYRSGVVTHIESRIVYEKDHFEIVYGTQQGIKHIPYIGGDRGKIIAAYAIAKVKDSPEPFVEMMSKNEIDLVRSCSKAKNKFCWTKFEAEMSRKTVVRRLFKYLPKTPEIKRILEIDDEQYIDQANEIKQLAAGIEAVKQKLLEKPQEQGQGEEHPQEDTEMPEQEQPELANVEGQEMMFD